MKAEKIKMVRLPNSVHTALKEYCEAEGRKLEWAVSTAATMWLMLKEQERDYLRELYAIKGPVLMRDEKKDE